MTTRAVHGRRNKLCAPDTADGNSGSDSGRWIQLGLDSCLDHIQWASDDAGHASCGCASGNLQGQADISIADPASGHILLLLVQSELNGRKWKISKDGRLVTIVEGGESFLSNDGPGGIDGGAVVVTRGEEGIVVSPLELETSLQNFRRNVNERSGKIGEET